MLSIRVDDEVELPLLLPHYSEPLFALVSANRLRLREWLPWVDRTHSPADIRAFAEDSLRRFAEGSTVSVAIRYRGQWAGGSGLKIDRINHRAEIGYWIAADHEGKGIITRTTRALAAYAFDELQLHRVEVRCSPRNVRSCAVPERLGFVHEGTLRETFACGGGYQDMRIYSLLAHELMA